MVILFGEIRHREGGSEEGGETFVTIALAVEGRV